MSQCETNRRFLIGETNRIVHPVAKDVWEFAWNLVIGGHSVRTTFLTPGCMVECTPPRSTLLSRLGWSSSDLGIALHRAFEKFEPLLIGAGCFQSQEIENKARGSVTEP
eukprot:2725437-Amphidinium_carterae.1